MTLIRLISAMALCLGALAGVVEDAANAKVVVSNGPKLGPQSLEPRRSVAPHNPRFRFLCVPVGAEEVLQLRTAVEAPAVRDVPNELPKLVVPAVVRVLGHTQVLPETREMQEEVVLVLPVHGDPQGAEGLVPGRARRWVVERGPVVSSGGDRNISALGLDKVVDLLSCQVPFLPSLVDSGNVLPQKELVFPLGAKELYVSVVGARVGVLQ